jgi:hypothetical protein
MSATVNVERAELRTATITVRALTIDRRQVTLAVFRQLREEPLIDTETGHFHGLPWGTVNYCPDKRVCGGDPASPWRPHLHVAWQRGDELRRATERPPTAKFAGWSELAVDWLALALDDGWRPNWWGGSDEYPYCLVAFGDGDWATHCSLMTNDYGVRVALGMVDNPSALWTTKGNEWLAARAAEIRADGRTREELATAINADINAQHEVWCSHHARWRELGELPQLFIAT